MPPAKTADATMETTLAAIVAHPTRARAFLILAERTASPAEIAKEIGKDVGHVGYHVRKLQQLDLIELVDEKPVRGAVEHFYRAVVRPITSTEDEEELSFDKRLSFARTIWSLITANDDATNNPLLHRQPLVLENAPNIAFPMQHSQNDQLLSVHEIINPKIVKPTDRPRTQPGQLRRSARSAQHRPVRRQAEE